MEPLEYFLLLMNIHITRGEESSGPFSLEEVQAYLAEGILLPDDLAWHEGLENWIPLAELVGQPAAPESAPLPPVSVVAEAVPVEQVPVESMASPGVPTSRNVQPAERVFPLTLGANIRSSERKTISTAMSVRGEPQSVIEPAGDR